MSFRGAHSTCDMKHTQGKWMKTIQSSAGTWELGMTQPLESFDWGHNPRWLLQERSSGLHWFWLENSNYSPKVEQNEPMPQSYEEATLNQGKVPCLCPSPTPSRPLSFRKYSIVGKFYMAILWMSQRGPVSILTECNQRQSIYKNLFPGLHQKYTSPVFIPGFYDWPLIWTKSFLWTFC